MNNNKQKKGISLIILVITILIIVILAVILTLNKNNPIENAKQAAKKNDMSMIEERAKLIVNDILLLKKGVLPENIQEEVHNKLKELNAFTDEQIARVKVEENGHVEIIEKVPTEEKNLIADDYIPAYSFPNGIESSPTYEYAGYWEYYEGQSNHIFHDYNGSESIVDVRLRNLNSKYYKYLEDNRETSENINMKVVAHMMDVDVWWSFAGEVAECV